MHLLQHAAERASAIGQNRTWAAYFMYRMEIGKPIAKPTQ